MDDDDLTTSSPRCVYHLVSSSDDVETQSRSLAESLDDTPGIQAEITLSDLLSDSPYDVILRSAKVGSRYGKDLLDVYIETIRKRIDTVDEAVLSEELEAQFRKNRADPYQAALTADILNIGIDIESKLREAIEDCEGISFNHDDLAAGVGFAVEDRGIESSDTYGAIVVRIKEPLSTLVDRRSTGGLSNTIQQLIFSGLSVYLVGPRGDPNEVEIVQEQFRSLGSFSVEVATETEFTVSEATTEFVEDWYDRLSFDVADGRVSEQTIRPASVAAYDLPQEPVSEHFFRAIVDGLQVKYADKKANQELFEELWAEQIKPHPQYTQYGSRRNQFPTVVLAREDGRKREFRLTYRGPNTKPHIDGVPVQSDEVEQEFVNLLERYLDAEPVTEERWETLVERIESGVGRQIDIDPAAVADSALLRRTRIRSKITPLLSPETEPAAERAEQAEKDVEWYEDHWRTILSGYEITTTTGTSVIEEKQNLCSELDPDSQADSALYYKLQRDIENAWEYFLEDLREQIRTSLPDVLDVDIVEQEENTRTDVRVTVHPPETNSIETVVSVYLPFSDVRVDGTEVQRANVPTVVSQVLETFEGVLYARSRNSDPDLEALLLDLLGLYCEVVEVNADDLVYFEEIVTFARSLPSISEPFQEPDRNLEDSIYQTFSSDKVMNQLRDAGIKFHRKGSDDRQSVKVRGDQYIAMELRDGVPRP